MINAEDLARAKVVTVGEALQSVAQPNKAVTVGEALQAVARSKAGDKPVDFADAAAVQAAVEVAGDASSSDVARELVARAMQAAETNVKPADERAGGVATVRLRDVLTAGSGEEGGGAASLLPGGNKPVTKEDAEKVAAAARSSAGKRGAGTGKAVVEAVTAAADMNERRVVSN